MRRGDGAYVWEAGEDRTITVSSWQGGAGQGGNRAVFCEASLAQGRGVHDHHDELQRDQLCSATPAWWEAG